MTTHSRILAWEPHGQRSLQAIVHGGCKRVGHDLVTAAAATAESLQSCLTLCDPIPGILQARTLEWVAISFSNA